jgi:hypothetical protein
LITVEMRSCRSSELLSPTVPGMPVPLEQVLRRESSLMGSGAGGKGVGGAEAKGVTEAAPLPAKPGPKPSGEAKKTPQKQKKRKGGAKGGKRGGAHGEGGEEVTQTAKPLQEPPSVYILLIPLSMLVLIIATAISRAYE